ncbi:MAG: hypothetical protein G01um101470_1100, partial [Parcubacteria group bacterium Gr01-1014_70]
AERVVYKALELVGKKMSVENPITIFDLALDNIAPSVEVRSRILRGRNQRITNKIRINEWEN